MKGTLVLILFVILVSSCKIQEENPKEFCNSDLDCAVGGCSSQLCGLKEELQNVVTTCEWRDVYSCYRLTNCSCVNNKCQWKENKAFKDCLKRFDEELK